MSNSHHHKPFKKFVFGTADEDVLNGTNGHDLLFGFGGDDQIFGLRGNDIAFGGRGDDRVDGGEGHDILFGENGNDGLAGGDGNDNLHGGGGRDFVVGGAGKDDLTGGGGSDKFVLRQGSGTDTIKDLQSDDRIDLRDYGFASAEDVLNAFRQRGHDAVLDLGGGNKLIIKDTHVSQLDAAQFIVSDAATGPSSSQSPYVVGVDAAISTVSLLTVGDEPSNGTGWQMVGIPDGLGAFDNGDGTFTVLMNHELGATEGVVRDHGFAGAFVSKLTIDKTTLEVLSGEDLITQAFSYNPGTGDYDPLAAAIGRLCSADLPAETAFFNPETGLGYNGGRIFLSGEEIGNEGRAFAHFVTGTEAGHSYELAWLGNMSYENQLANPNTGDKTVVALTDDSTPGQVYFYVGDKKAAAPGLDSLDLAGLTGGTFYGLKVTELDTLADNNNESNGTTLGGDYQSAFTLESLGDVSGKTGAQIQADSETNEVTEFLRPEDGQWDTIDPDVFYFTTTNGFGQPSRLWAAEFNDASNPAAGGTIRMLLDGTEGQQMLDNMTVTKQGKILLQEDPGNQTHLAKIWEYDPTTDKLLLLAQHDPDRFDPAAPAGGEPFLTQDEESSGIIDVTDILGSAGQNAFLFDVQAHYSIPGELVQGGQLGLMYQDLI
jgi:RTX calcium-binding nonapeptide repeat (4 copies)